MMKRQLIAQALIATACLLPLSASAADTTENYTFDASHTYVLWHVNHFGYSIQSGKFAMVEGSLTLDDTKPQNSKVNVTINTKDIVTGVPKLDEHLKNKDFFNVEKYPTATFVSDKVEVTGKDKGKVHGTLTLLGVSKPVTLDVTFNKNAIHPISNKKTVGFSATTTIKRSDFGMKYGVPGVADDVKIDIGSEANLVSKS